MTRNQVKTKIDDAHKQYKDGLITKQELKEQLGRITEQYDIWLKRNK